MWVGPVPAVRGVMDVLHTLPGHVTLNTAGDSVTMRPAVVISEVSHSICPSEPIRPGAGERRSSA